MNSNNNNNNNNNIKELEMKCLGIRETQFYKQQCMNPVSCACLCLNIILTTERLGIFNLTLEIQLR
jgi:hypothetical protein